MARKPRIEFEGAFYHVITRGNQRQKIFREEGAYVKYLEILAGYKALYKFSLYAYVLMSNHVHLLIETGRTPLSKILQSVNQSYTAWFNKENRTVGPGADHPAHEGEGREEERHGTDDQGAGYQGKCQ